MNKSRRAKLSKILSKLEVLIEEVERLHDAEEEQASNLDGKDTERAVEAYDRCVDALSFLEDAASRLDEAKDAVENAQGDEYP